MFDRDDDRPHRRPRPRQGPPRRPRPGAAAPAARRDDRHGAPPSAATSTTPTTSSSCVPPRGCAARPRLPGDKSISHRALLLALLAAGESRIAGAGDGDDVRSTAGIVAALGADGAAGRRARRPGRLPRRVARRRRARRARRTSSTAATPGPRARLVAGVLAGRDAVRDPRRRRLAPAAADGPGRRAAGLMGATFAGRAAPRCCRSRSPAARPLTPITYDTPVPSAQVKSAILLAAPRGRRRDVGHRGASRPATTPSGCCGPAAWPSTRAPAPDGAAHGPRRRARRPWRRSTRPCPSDPSAAAFWLVAGVDPSRRRAAPRRGEHEPDAACHHRHPEAHGRRHRGARSSLRPGGADGEPLADLVVRSSVLRAIDLSPAEVAAAIDEIPILALAAAVATGTTPVPRRGRAPAQGVRPDRGDRGRAHGALGADVRVEGDDIEIHGGRPLAGAVTETHDDHRLAMTFAIAGLLAEGETIVRRPGSASVSYPGFRQELEGVRA